jgi:hypothetical protein
MKPDKKFPKQMWVASWVGETGWFHQVFDTKKAARHFYDLHKPDIPELELGCYEHRG